MESPTPQAVRDLRERHGVSQSLLAQLLHVKPRAVQHWETPADHPLNRSMPPGLFELALIKLGESPLTHGYVALTAAEIPVVLPPRAKGPRLRAPRQPRPAATPKTPPTPKPPKPAKPERITGERLRALRALAQRSAGLTPIV